MKQLGNLAIVCARRQDILLQVLDGKVSVHAGHGPEKGVLCARWDDDVSINEIIWELNFGRYAEVQEGAEYGSDEQRIAG